MDLWPEGQGQHNPYYSQPRQSNGLAVASLVFGITSIIFCWCGLLALAQVIMAIVFGSVAISKANHGASGRGPATAGLVLGIFGGAIWFLLGLLTLGVLWVV